MVIRPLKTSIALPLLLLLWSTAPVLAQGPPQRRVTGTCPPGASIRVINADGSVVCEVDDNSGGTVTSVGTGSGLTGGPITTTGTISIAPGGVTSAHIADGTVGAVDGNSGQVQLRVTGTCTSDSAIQAVSADGAVTCQSVGRGTVTAVTASAPLVSSGGTTPNISLPNVTIDATNTAIGVDALRSNTGAQNTASGVGALFNNTTGIANTASGRGALQSNTTGISNTASGVQTLQSNTTGTFNTASGVSALGSNTTGNSNTASGVNVLVSNTTGSQNTASGVSALEINTTGNSNTASGAFALLRNTTGDRNIAVGVNAGQNQTTGSDNIYLGNPGVAAEGGTIRIGLGGLHQRAFIAGIFNFPVVGDAVFVDSAGQLGILVSSRRFKEEIQDMGEASQGLMRLRPVTFRYKTGNAGGARPLEYGLIAEEVAEVYPELVGYAATGEAQSVQYHKVNVLLLHEVQQQHRKIEEQSEELKALKAETAQLKASLETLERMLGPVAQR